MNKINLQLFAVDPKTTKASDLAKVRDVDFTNRFSAGIQTLMNMLGITRKIEKKAGEVLKAYKVTGTLESGAVAEGEVIPLSKYATEYVPIGEVVLNKWRKKTTLEAINNKGYGQAVNDTNDKMLRDIQKGIRSKLVTFAGTGTGTATGETLQGVIAQTWGKSQIIWEDTDVQLVHFINPLDIADYLANKEVTLEKAFGFSYIQDFLAMGTVILASDIPQGKVYTTAIDNIILYFVDVNSADIQEGFEFTADETGLIGIHTGSSYNDLSSETVAVSGVGLFAERLGGVVVGTITDLGA